MLALVIFGFCIITIFLPSVLGVLFVRLWRGALPKDDEIANPLSIAVGFAFVIAVSAFAALSDYSLEHFGPHMRYLGLFAAVTFAVGIVIGWIEARGTDRK